MSVEEEGRQVSHPYQDPLSLIWLGLAAQLGLKVVRDDATFASYDGKGTLSIATDAILDPDDTLAQMIFHELCHSLVMGKESMRKEDWGLDNTSESHVVHEHASHRLQAYWSGDYGLRTFLAVTTDHRPHYDALPSAPLGPAKDPSITMARLALTDARERGWWEPICAALKKTAVMAASIRELVPANSLWKTVVPMHPLEMFPLGYHGRTCGDCAWSVVAGNFQLCLQSKSEKGDMLRNVELSWPDCDRFEEELTPSSCQECGACCRQAFSFVAVGSHEPFVQKHGNLLEKDGDRLILPRPGGHCVALRHEEHTGYRCGLYEDRPRGCVDFELGSLNCLLARRRVGLSR
jgi:hypothetical protein